MEQLKMHAIDYAKENVQKVAQLFPNCVTETANGLAIDFEKLQQELSEDIMSGSEERYQFTWPGKRAAIREANSPCYLTLRPSREDSVDFDKTKNLYIEGDNLQVLKLLRESYLGKVKMIYIDPPYNTGNDFVYNDDFSQSSVDYKSASDMFDEDGNMLLQNYEVNSETSGRFHSGWLNMMYPRLKVAKDLLTDDGVIFISIDDNEVDNLRKVCNEIYGEHNLVAQLIWEQGRKSMAAQIAVNHEYCLVYCKNRNACIEDANNSGYPYWMQPKKGLESIYSEYERLKTIYKNDFASIENGMKTFYKNLPDDNPSKAHSHYCRVDKKGLYFPGDIAQGTGNGGRFPILHPITKKPCKMPSGGWRFGESKLPALLAEDRIHFGLDETTVPCLKRYLKETEYEVMSSVFYKDGRGASKRLDALFNQQGLFPFPKDEYVIKSFISAGSNQESIILDFFSGSATTAHAMFLQNAVDKGTRKFIIVQLPEATESNSEAYEAGYRNICEIGKERIRRAGKKIKEEAGDKAKDLDTGFRVLKLASSNMNDVFYNPQDTNLNNLFAENIKSDRTPEDLLFQVLPELNLPLSAKIEAKTIAGKLVFIVEDNYLAACFDENITDECIAEIAKTQPYHFVMRESGAQKDQVLDNFDQLFKAYSPKTQTHVM